MTKRYRWTAALLLALSTLGGTSAVGAAPVRFGHPHTPVRRFPEVFCVPGTRPVSKAGLLGAAAVINTRISFLTGGGPGVGPAGPRCLRVLSPQGAILPGLLTAAAQPGRVVLADSSARSLTASTYVRLIHGHARVDLASHPPALRVVIFANGISSGSASVSTDSAGRPAVTFALTVNGARRLCRFTSTHVQHYLAIVLDNHIISDPMIQSAICGGQLQIVGLNTNSQARVLAAYLNSGPLALPLVPLAPPPAA